MVRGGVITSEGLYDYTVYSSCMDLNRCIYYYKSYENNRICGISMKKGNTELLEAVNGVLATMTVEDYEAMMQEAIAVQPLSE